MVVILLGMLFALAVSLALRLLPVVREGDVDHEREYRPPPTLGQLPNVRRGRAGPRGDVGVHLPAGVASR